MIRVTKGAKPTYLSKAAGPATAALAAAVAAGKKPDAAPDKYGHDDVRQALATAQHGKCCYCEVRIPVPYAHKHVEHFRPKARVRQDEASVPINPGYYWLAYEWDNLYIACSHCNSAYKGDLFPLVDPAGRALSPSDDIAQEQPLLLDPGGPDDPEDHIGFHLHTPKGNTEKGRMTVKVIGLDCAKREDRLEHFKDLRKLLDEIIVLKNAPPDPGLSGLVATKMKELLLSQRPDRPYSVMAKTFYRQHVKPAVTPGHT